MADIKKLLTALIEKYGDQSVADLIGVTVRSLYNYRSGESAPREKTVRKIEEIFRKFQEGSDPMTVNDPQTPYKANGTHVNNYTEKYIALLEAQTKDLQSRIKSQERLEWLQVELQKNRALLNAALEHIALLRASVEKKPLEKIQTEMGNAYFSALGLDGKTI